MNPTIWIGYLEHATDKDLEYFQKNIGKGGFTIFAKMLMATQRRNLQELPWCATFVHAVINRPDILGKAHPGCRVLERRMKRKKYWREPEDYTPMRGDIVFYSNSKTKYVDHCGFVEAYDGTQLVTINGNGPDDEGHFGVDEGGCVCRLTYAASDPKIVGYAAIGTLYSW